MKNFAMRNALRQAVIKAGKAKSAVISLVRDAVFTQPATPVKKAKKKGTRKPKK